MRPVPLIVLERGSETAAALAVALGWDVVHDRATAEPGQVVALGLRADADLVVAVTLAVRGVGLIAGCDALSAPQTATLCDDLRRLGSPGYVPADAVPDVEARALLDLLATGRSLGEAARALHLSRRSADRRLADARLALGASTTAQAVALTRTRPLCPSPL